MNVLFAVLGFVVALGILVVVHEFGHYSVARLAGVKVLRFSIGFGRPLFSRRAANGTEWRVGWLPLGGYVKMLDERESETPLSAEELPHAFNRKSVGRRFAIVAAGPIANFLLAILLLSGIYAAGVTEPMAVIAPPAAGSAAARAGLVGGESIVAVRMADSNADDTVTPVRSWPDLRFKLLDAAFDQRDVVLIAAAGNRRVDHPLHLAGADPGAPDQDFMDTLGLQTGGGQIYIAAVEAGSPAAASGLKTGDVIKTVDGRVVGDASALVALVRTHPGKLLRLGLLRDGQPLTLAMTPVTLGDPQAGHLSGRIGAALGMHLPSVEVRYGPLEALQLGARRTWDISIFSLRMFGRMLDGQASLRNLSGPVTIADYAGRSARMGLAPFISFLALVSISLGVLNLLPIPVLDGGHLLYYAVEAATGRPVSERWQAILQRAGLACILALSAVALFNDLTRLITS
ncbi:MAG: RIP metalloprotease RseP [Janthinobacterium lividum]